MGVIPKSLIERFAATQTKSIDAGVLQNKTVADLGELKAKIELFAVVGTTSKIADARKRMAEKGQGCSDVIVTQDGTVETVVVGWLTDDLLAQTPDRPVEQR